MPYCKFKTYNFRNDTSLSLINKMIALDFQYWKIPRTSDTTSSYRWWICPCSVMNCERWFMKNISSSSCQAQWIYVAMRESRMVRIFWRGSEKRTSWRIVYWSEKISSSLFHQIYCMMIKTMFSYVYDRWLFKYSSQ